MSYLSGNTIPLIFYFFMLEYYRKGLCVLGGGNRFPPPPPVRSVSAALPANCHMLHGSAAIFTGYRQRQVKSRKPPSLQDTGSGR
jgi:hypothetical protein